MTSRGVFRVLVCGLFLSLLILKVYPSNITVSGTISTDSTWGGVDTVYVDGNLTVASTAKVTIDPGTIVTFTGWYKLTVNGIIHAIGAIDDTIEFTKEDTTGFYDFSTITGGWAGIELNTSNAVDSFMFRFCKIEFIKNSGVQTPTGISFLGGKRFDLQRSVYKNNLGCVYGEDISNFYIDSCSFFDNFNYDYDYPYSNEYDIYLWDFTDYYITNNTIITHTYNSIRTFRCANGYIDNNSITADINADASSLVYEIMSLENGTGPVEVSNNTLTKNAHNPYGIKISNSCAIVDSNIISDIYVGILYTSLSSGIISNNTIDNCSIGIDCDASSSFITGNTISNCSQQGAFFHAFSTDTLENNIFKNNTKGIESNQSYVDIYNTIVNNNTTYGIFFNKSTSSGASLNLTVHILIKSSHVA